MYSSIYAESKEMCDELIECAENFTKYLNWDLNFLKQFLL